MDYPQIFWQEATIGESLKTLEDYAVAYGANHKSYYQKHSSFKRNWAKSLRVVAIVAGAVAGLLPILSQISKDWAFYLDPAWSTVAVTVAITAIGLDRFFGFSSAWMRFITTQLTIEAKIGRLQLNLEAERFSWQGQPPSFDKAKACLAIIVAFLNEVSEIVKDETNTWTVEFQNVLQKFNEEMNVKAETVKFGGLHVIVENADLCKGGLFVHLEGSQPVRFQGTSYAFNNLYPKIYRVAVYGTATEEKEGRQMNRELRTEALVNVAPGAVTDATLRLA